MSAKRGVVDPDGIPNNGDEYRIVNGRKVPVGKSAPGIIDPDGIPNNGDEYRFVFGKKVYVRPSHGRRQAVTNHLKKRG